MSYPEKTSTLPTLNGLFLDPTRQAVIAGGKAHHLTPMEYKLLATLMSHPGEILTREFLMRQVWETDWVGDCATLEVHISRLRKKIEQDPSNPRYILTFRGIGYMFREHPDVLQT